MRRFRTIRVNTSQKSLASSDPRLSDPAEYNRPTITGLGMCYPDQLWYETRTDARGQLVSTWRGVNVWMLLDIMRMVGEPKENLDMIVSLL